MTRARNLANRASDIVSVKDFGAKGDGVTDDSAAFTAALAYLSPSGGVLEVPVGTYKLTSSLTIPSSVSIIGDGRAKSILNFLGCSGLASANGSQHVRIEGVYILGNDTASTYGVEIDNNPRGVVMRDVFIRRFGAAGNGGGLYVHNTTTFDMWCAHFETVICEDNGRGMVFVNANSPTLLNCISRLNLGHSFVSDGCVNLNIIGGTYENPNGAAAPQYNLWLKNTNQFAILGVWSENARTNNLRIESSNGGIVDACLLNNVTDGGAGTYNNHIIGSTNISFRGTRINAVGAGETGIFVDNTSLDIDLAGIYYETVTGTQRVDQSKAAALTLTNGFTIPSGTQPVTESVYMVSSAGAVSSDASFAFLDGKDGQIVRVVNVGANSITIRNGARTKLAGATNFVMGQDDSLTLIYSSTRSLWLEVARTDL
jgi:hypothetical protein